MKRHPISCGNEGPVRKRVAWTLMFAALLASGCSFSWDSSGIKDVLLGGRTPSEIGAAKTDETATNADVDMHADQAAPPPKKPESAEDEDSAKRLRRIAVLPVAWTGEGGGQPCDLCPESVAMKATNPLSARLATGFIYEAIARHPRFLFPTPDTVEKAMVASGRSMKGAAASLAAAHKADVVIATALIELRPRIGSDDAPETPAGVAMFMALVDAASGKVLWSDTFDQNESGRNMVLKTYDKLMNDRPVRWSTADGYAEHAVDELVEDLVGEVD